MNASRKFFAAMSSYGRDQTTTNTGLVFNGTTVCIPEASVEAGATNEFCNPPANAVYACTGDANKWLAETAYAGPAMGTFLTQAEYDSSYGSLPTN